MTKDKLKQKYINQGYKEPFAEEKALQEFNGQIINIPVTMPAMVPNGYDMGDLD